MNERLVYLGHVAVFYIPMSKLDDWTFGEDNQTPRELFDHFLMANYNAYTLETGDTEGFWREHPESPIIRDENARYEVSFEGDIDPFVDFLSTMCSLLKEDAIYLTVGYRSWLVLPKEKNEV